MASVIAILLAAQAIEGVPLPQTSTPKTHLSGTYECRVLSISDLAKDGRLVASVYAPVAVGSSFLVDRMSGRYSGSFLNNVLFQKAQVEFAPPDNSFYVVSVGHPPNMQVEYLAIRDWAEGPLKPFIFTEAGRVLTGTCRLRQ
jgi:hypothetical protein